MRLAYLAIDGEPFCVECADVEIERLAAFEYATDVDVYGRVGDVIGRVDLREILTREKPGKPTRPSWLLREWESADMTKLNELRRQWVAFQQIVADVDRCIALVPFGDGRCIRRRMADERLCETHYTARYHSRL